MKLVHYNTYKLVEKTRKEHTCFLCDSLIPKASRLIRYTGYDYSKTGRKIYASFTLCYGCCERIGTVYGLLHRINSKLKELEMGKKEINLKDEISDDTMAEVIRFFARAENTYNSREGLIIWCCGYPMYVYTLHANGTVTMAKSPETLCDVTENKKRVAEQVLWELNHRSM